MPNLFHWRMNYIDIVYNIFDSPKSTKDSLKYSKISLSIHRGSKTKFYYKEEVVIKTFYIYIFVYFISQLPKEYI